MIFRFLFECEEALQASVSNRIIIYPLTDSTLTPAHDDPSPSPHHTLIHDAADCAAERGADCSMYHTSSLLALHCAALPILNN